MNRIRHPDWVKLCVELNCAPNQNTKFPFHYTFTQSSMIVNLLRPSILNTYSLSMSSLFTVINFLVLWSICLSSSPVNFKNGLEYLTRGTAQVLIALMIFLLQSLVSRSFLVLLRYSFLIFFFSSLHV